MSLAILNDNKCYLLGLVDTITGVAVNNATLTFSVADKSGNVVASNVAMPYQGGSQGNYIGVLPGSTTLSVAGNPYTITIVAATPITFRHQFSVNAEVG